MKKTIFLLLASLVIISLTVVSATPQTIVKKAAKSAELQKNMKHFPLRYLQKHGLSYDIIFDGRRKLKEDNHHYLPGQSHTSVTSYMNQVLNPEEIISMQASIEDFQVNDDAIYGSHRASAISANGNGNFVICWQHNTNWDDFNIYAQRYASNGTAVGGNFKVNEYTINNWYMFPAISINDEGNFVICWTDDRNGDTDVYALRYASNGATLGANFKVNEDTGNAEQKYPAISVDGDGNFVICWQDTRNGADFDIYAQHFTNSGSPLGSNFKVNDDTGNALQKSPAISSDDNGNFVICWRDSRNTGGGFVYDIYAQRFTSNGNMVGSNFEVNENLVQAGLGLPDISVDGSGNFVICWDGFQNGYFHIFAQRYSGDGSALGTNFRVNDDTEVPLLAYPVISCDASGAFAVCWFDERNGNFDIYAQRYNFDGQQVGDNYKVNNDAGTVMQFVPDLSYKNGKIHFVWEDNRNGSDWDIFARIEEFVSNQSPVADAGLDQTIIVGETVQLDGSGSNDPDGTIESYIWYFGDSTPPVEGVIVEHVYANAGEYTASLVVTDDDGAEDTDETSITVITTNDAIDELIILVEGLSLLEGLENGLISKLENAINSIENGNYEAAINQINAFINHVNAQSGKKISEQDADELIEYVSRIIHSLGNNLNKKFISENDGNLETRLLDNFTLYQNYPNPFNPKTIISFAVAKLSDITIDIYNIDGQFVTNLFREEKNPGYYRIIWNVESLPAGTYFIHMQANDFVQVRKCVLLK